MKFEKNMKIGRELRFKFFTNEYHRDDNRDAKHKLAITPALTDNGFNSISPLIESAEEYV